ncbi:MAG: hypothetical protein KKH92_08175 [Firmicutes bacterium]|nr:hypothetical protein [Bacillota bacterium]
MKRRILIPIIILVQFVIFFYYLLVQSSFGFPMVYLLDSFIDIDFIDSIIPFSLEGSRIGGYLFLAFLFPLFFLLLYEAINRLNPSFKEYPSILFYWFFWINVILLIIFATLARAYLGFILIIIYMVMIILFQKSFKKTQNQSKSIGYVKLYLHYLIINFLFIPIQLGIFVLFYIGN